MKTKSFGFIGGGRIARFLLHALKQKDGLPEKVVVADPNEDAKQQVAAIDTTVITCGNNNIDVLNVDILFLAVHPPVLKNIATEITGKIAANTLVLSLLPAISMDKLTVMLGGVKKLVRFIPNAPSIVHKGYNPVVFSEYITNEEKQYLQKLCSYFGEAPEVDENKLEAYAIVTAMGPTYFWFQWLKLQELGKQFGLEDTELKKAMPAMLHGAVNTLFESDLSPKEVLDLIPIYPLKENEPTIQDIFENKMKELFLKLSGI